VENGAWYLNETMTGSVGADGTLGPVGVCELHRRLAALNAPPDLVLDASGVSRTFDYEVFFGLYNRVKNAGGKVVVVDGTGALANFFFGLSLACPVPVVPTREAARRLLSAYAERSLLRHEPSAGSGGTVNGGQEGVAGPQPSRRARLVRRASIGTRGRRHRPVAPLAA
jgi:hypothetical protein